MSAIHNIHTVAHVGVTSLFHSDAYESVLAQHYYTRHESKPQFNFKCVSLRALCTNRVCVCVCAMCVKPRVMQIVHVNIAQHTHTPLTTARHASIIQSQPANANIIGSQKTHALKRESTARIARLLGLCIYACVHISMLS